MKNFKLKSRRTLAQKMRTTQRRYVVRTNAVASVDTMSSNKKPNIDIWLQRLFWVTAIVVAVSTAIAKIMDACSH